MKIQECDEVKKYKKLQLYRSEKSREGVARKGNQDQWSTCIILNSCKD